MKTLPKTYRFAIVAAIASFALIFAWRMQCAPYGDDYMYSHVFEIEELDYSYENTLGQPIENVEQLGVSIYRHYLSNNGRLSNIAAFVVLFLPNLLAQAIMAASICIFPFLILLAAGGKRLLQRPLAVASALAVIWIALPWSDGMQSPTFLLNYVFPADAMLAVVCLSRRAARVNRVVAPFLLAFIAGWFHESYALTIIAYLVATMILQPQSRCRVQKALLAGAVVGFIAAFSPGTVGRLMHNSGVHAGLGAYIHGALGSMGYIAMPAFFIAAVAVLAKKRWRKKFNATFIVALCAAALCALGIAVATQAAQRALWPCITLALVGLYSIASEVVSPAFTRARRYATAVISVIYLLFFINLIHYQRIDWLTFEAVHAKLATGDEIVYHDLPAAAPWTTLGIPLTHRYTDNHNLYYEGQATGHSPRVRPIVAPERYRGLPFDQWDSIPGNTHFRRAGDLIIADHRPGGAETIQLTVTYGAPSSQMSPLNRALLALLGPHSSLTLTATLTAATAVPSPASPASAGATSTSTPQPTSPSISTEASAGVTSTSATPCDSLYIVVLPPQRRFHLGRPISSITLPN